MSRTGSNPGQVVWECFSMQGPGQGTGDQCAGTKWGCAEGTGVAIDRGLEESRLDFPSLQGYMVWARAIKRSTGWVVLLLPPQLWQDWFQKAFARPGKALKLEIPDQQGRLAWYRDSKECWSQK
ncbi:hypothetical protein F5J12DRAFT_781687 [Pisolithus orientalis]|uniref:uncharacterized protein n=1 Tax=Pisolithus orientalis TaxID=936130 RepID=UPI0022258277|nr:uncharacterized protein F5J12DRAFT_781687 [Pisolithus orientalis]KAI6010671.1 hypothetical protein F5J12DRAFT_781687 [Pisolithus orientalis]